MNLHRCLFCLAGAAAELRYDRRGRPFITCRLCQTRSFVRSLDALRGLAVAPPLLEGAIQRRASEPEFRAWFDREIAQLVREVRAGAAASAPAPAEQRGLPAASALPFEMEIA